MLIFMMNVPLHIIKGRYRALSIIEINESLIFLSAEFEDAESAMRRMSSEIRARGYVRESYCDAVLERERNFPTGVPEEGLGGAVPHATSEHVITSAMAVAVLERPVRFNLMGSPDESADVDIIFMLAVNTPQDHMRALGKVISILMSPEKTDCIRNIKNAADAAAFLEKEINAKKVESCI